MTNPHRGHPSSTRRARGSDMETRSNLAAFTDFLSPDVPSSNIVMRCRMSMPRHTCSAFHLQYCFQQHNAAKAKPPSLSPQYDLYYVAKSRFRTGNRGNTNLFYIRCRPRQHQSAASDDARSYLPIVCGRGQPQGKGKLSVRAALVPAAASRLGRYTAAYLVWHSKVRI